VGSPRAAPYSEALTTPTPYALPRRSTSGLDLNRLYLITAVLSKRAGLPLANQDIIANVVGGYRIEEPAADLGLALAIASSLKNHPLPPDLVCLGEVGLTGEIRPVPRTEQRLQEAAHLGFKKCLVPPGAGPASGLEVLPAPTLRQAISLGLSHER